MAWAGTPPDGAVWKELCPSFVSPSLCELAAALLLEPAARAWFASAGVSIGVLLEMVLLIGEGLVGKRRTWRRSGTPGCLPQWTTVAHTVDLVKSVAWQS